MGGKKVLVIGGGAAGMMAALTAAEAGHAVTLLEKNGKTGKKLLMTGNGRCNVTNACDIETFLDHVVSGRNFLYSAIYSFSNEDMIRFLAESGLETKVEDHLRVFPVTDRAADVLRVLAERMRRAGVRVQTGMPVRELQIDGICRGVVLGNGDRLEADVTILAAGGKSVPGTGSTGDGYRMAEAAGHTIRPLRPALAPFVIREGWIRELQGRVFGDVRLTVAGDSRRKLYDGRGEVLFTHFGISGPMVLAAGSYCAEALEKLKELSARLEFFPDTPAEELEKHFLQLLNENGKKQIGTVFAMLAPKPLVPALLKKNGIRDDLRAGELPRGARQALLGDLKSMSLTVSGMRGFKEAMITQGGVSLDEVDPVTMESLLVKGLRFAGEVLDLDALTGGYNLQIAWSTGHAAGSGIE